MDDDRHLRARIMKRVFAEDADPRRALAESMDEYYNPQRAPEAPAGQPAPVADPIEALKQQWATAEANEADAKAVYEMSEKKMIGHMMGGGSDPGWEAATAAREEAWRAYNAAVAETDRIQKEYFAAGGKEMLYSDRN